MELKELHMFDISRAECVEVVWNGKTLWVNVNGICALRSQQAEKTVFTLWQGDSILVV